MAKILIACEESQTVCKAFRELGHESYSCDIIPCSGGHPEWHIQNDAIKVLNRYKWDLVIAHPPCTFLTNAGVRHLHSAPSRNGVIAKIHGAERWEEMRKAALFFNEFVNYAKQGNRTAIENPVPHRYAREIIGNYTQLIQPWQFGHMERKATCLWLFGLPGLHPTNNVYQEMKLLPKSEQQRINYLPPSTERAKLRSKTFLGIAAAMAEQWGKLFTEPFYKQQELFSLSS